MPEIKKAGLSVAVVISAALGASACSSIPLLDGSPVMDNMKYRSNDASIKALSIPPELSKPAFDDSYALNKPVNPAPVVKAPMPVVQQSSSNASGMGRGSPTQEMLNSQDAPTQAGTVAPVVQVRPAAPAPVVQAQSAPAPVAKTEPAPSSRTQVIMTKVKSGEPALAVNAPASQTWPRLSGMLPKVGFEVTKQQPKQGIYTIVYKGSSSAPDRGLLSRLLSSEDESAKSDSPLTAGETYLVLLVGNASQQSFVGVRNSAGKPADPAIATHILGLLKGQYEL